MGSPQPAFGHQRLLLGLLLYGMLNLLLFLTVLPELLVLQPILWITSVIVVYLDAKEVNRAQGRDLLGAGGWAVLVLFFWIISLPWYLFRSRPRVMSVPSLQNAPSQDVLEAIRKLGELKETGVVTEDEFRRKKQELLSRI